MPFEEWLDLLSEHEVAYAGMVAHCERTPYAWYLYAPEIPEYRDANRALRLRTNGSSAETVARDVIAYYRSRGLPPVADVDPVAEAQGIGAALRRMNVNPVDGDRVLMRFDGAEPPSPSYSGVVVQTIPNETGAGEAAEWIETAVADDVGLPDETLWRCVAANEARYVACRLYLGRVDGIPAGTCDLFESENWGRIDSVVTRPEFRRKGVASALVTYAVIESLTSGNNETYLFTEPGGHAERLYLRLGFITWHLNILRQHCG
jgi:GNAT superfamily N-acetyltransferase